MDTSLTTTITTIVSFKSRLFQMHDRDEYGTCLAQPVGIFMDVSRDKRN